MDFYLYIQELVKERARIDRAIMTLETMLGGRAAKRSTSRRGRRPGMTEAERRTVSERMQRYWAQRRRERAEPESGGGSTS